MKQSTLFITLTILLIFYKAQGFQNCGAIPVNYTVYDLCPFSDIPPFKVQGYQDIITFTLGKSHTPSCDGHEDIWGTYVDPSGHCANIAIQNPTYTLLDENDPQQGLKLTFPPETDVIDATTETYQFIVQLSCDKGADDVNQTEFHITYNGPIGNTRQIVLTGTTSSGCPVVSFNQLIDFLENNKHAFALIFALIGLFLTFFGLQLFKGTVFVAALVAGTLTSGTLFFEFTDLGTDSWILWTIFGVSVIVGLLLGYLTLKFEKLAYFVIGVTFGVVAGLMIFNAFILPFIQGDGSTLPLYLTLIISGLIGGGLGLCLIKSIVIVATSLAGAYMIVRAASVYFGGFPSETLVSQGNEAFSAVVYAYLAAVIIVAGLGMYYQSGASKAKRQQTREEQNRQAPAEGGKYYRY